MTTTIIKKVSGSGNFPSVSDTRIYELLPGGGSLTEINNFFSLYEELKNVIPVGNSVQNTILKEEKSASFGLTSTTTDVLSLVNKIKTMEIEPKSHQYLISEGGKISQGEIPTVTQAEVNTINEYVLKLASDNSVQKTTITGSLEVIKQFSGTMETLQKQFENFNSTVETLATTNKVNTNVGEIRISTNWNSFTTDARNFMLQLADIVLWQMSASGVLAQTSATSINMVVSQSKIYMDSVFDMSTQFLETSDYTLTNLYYDLGYITGSGNQPITPTGSGEQTGSKGFPKGTQE